MGSTHAVNSADPSVSYEHQIASDLVRRVLIVSPAVLLVAGLVSGVDGLVSAVWLKLLPYSIQATTSSSSNS